MGYDLWFMGYEMFNIKTLGLNLNVLYLLLSFAYELNIFWLMVF